MPENKTSTHVMIQGRVQGVGFRYFVLARAQARHLAGWVRNLPDGRVEALAVGGRTAIELWIEDLRQGPPMSRVDEIRVDWDIPLETMTGFEIW